MVDWRQLRVAVERFVRARLGDDQANEDIVQSVFVSAAEKLADDAEEIGNLPAWLLTVARRRVADELRHRQRQPVSITIESEPVPISSGQLSSEEQRICSCLDNAMTSLNEPDQSILTDIYWNGQTPTAFAIKHGLSASTVRTRLQRARGRLAGLLRQACSTDCGCDEKSPCKQSVSEK